MTRKRMVSWTAAAAGLILAATCGVAAAHGMHGGPHGGGPMWLLARAAGLSNAEIGSAFHKNSNLKADFHNMINTREAMATCIVKGASCKSEISAFANAKQKLITDKMEVWQSLFQSPHANTKRATEILGKLRSLRDQRHKIFKEVFASSMKHAPATKAK